MKKLLERLKKSNNKKGFTLIEVIVVLVILGILAAIAVPAVTGYIDDAKKSKYIAEARSIYLVVQTEEARCQALGDTETTYGVVAAVAKEKTKLEAVEITTPTANTKLSEQGDQGYKAEKIVVTWTSDDGKKPTATITRNKDVKINDVK